MQKPVIPVTLERSPKDGVIESPCEKRDSIGILPSRNPSRMTTGLEKCKTLVISAIRNFNLSVNMRILFIGDVVSRLGRRAVTSFLPTLKKGDSISLVVANVENLAGGRGATREKVEEVLNYGVDYCTSGDHIFYLKAFREEIEELPVLRPANYLDDIPGRGFEVLDLGKNKVLLINLLGLSIAGENVACPFRTVDRILEEHGSDVQTIVVDFHSENTSERRAMGFYLDGRISAMVGTHTHVPSADAQILPNGTAYVTDLGMCGARDSVLGVDKDIIIERYKYPYRQRFEWVKTGPAVFNSVLVEIGEDGKAVGIERVDRELA